MTGKRKVLAGDGPGLLENTDTTSVPATVADLTVAEATAITDKIRKHLDNAVVEITKAYNGRAWVALSYESWSAYCAEEFGDRFRLGRADRRDVVLELADAGLSTRAIASVTGASRNTVKADIRSDQVGQTDPPEPKPPELIVDQWSVEEHELRKKLESGQTVVVNMKRHPYLWAWAEKNGHAEKIDRNTVWGNPFVLGADGDRKTVIANYRKHYLPHKPSLNPTALKGKALGCWCSPEACHGDVLAEAAESVTGGRP